jgi:hypothetical protein
MPYLHGRNAFLSASTSDSASAMLSNDMTSLTLTWSKDNPITTTFGDLMNQRVSGLVDATLTGAYIWNSAESAGSSTAQLLDEMMAASRAVPLNYAPAGSIAGCPLFSGSWQLAAHEHTTPVNGTVTGTFTFQNGSGSVIAGSCA